MIFRRPQMESKQPRKTQNNTGTTKTPRTVVIKDGRHSRDSSCTANVGEADSKDDSSDDCRVTEQSLMDAAFHVLLSLPRARCNLEIFKEKRQIFQDVVESELKLTLIKHAEMFYIERCVHGLEFVGLVKFKTKLTCTDLNCNKPQYPIYTLEEYDLIGAVKDALSSKPNRECHLLEIENNKKVRFAWGKVQKSAPDKYTQFKSFLLLNTHVFTVKANKKIGLVSQSGGSSRGNNIVLAASDYGRAGFSKLCKKTGSAPPILGARSHSQSKSKSGKSDGALKENNIHSTKLNWRKGLRTDSSSRCHDPAIAVPSSQTAVVRPKAAVKTTERSIGKPSPSEASDRLVLAIKEALRFCPDYTCTANKLRVKKHVQRAWKTFMLCKAEGTSANAEFNTFLDNHCEVFSVEKFSSNHSVVTLVKSPTVNSPCITKDAKLNSKSVCKFNTDSNLNKTPVSKSGVVSRAPLTLSTHIKSNSSNILQGDNSGSLGAVKIHPPRRTKVQSVQTTLLGEDMAALMTDSDDDDLEHL